ncbi:hypothetical protein NE865_09141 [Phthorimaea operculella]|nr:hypothetical protein NE865_09141 [Phthorimaea operculella]
MTFTRHQNPHYAHYFVGNAEVTRVHCVRDLGVWFDPSLTFRNHAQHVTDAANRRLGFVLRSSAQLSPDATRTLYAALVRSILESNAVVWSPYEDKYILLLEKVQKKYLRSLYKRMYFYYPYMYPTLFIQGQLGYGTLEARRAVSILKFAVGLLRGQIDCSGLVGAVLQLRVPDMQLESRLRPRVRPLLEESAGCSQRRSHSPVELARRLLNALLAAAPHCDLFTTGLPRLMIECEIVCERMCERVSTIN